VPPPIAGVSSQAAGFVGFSQSFAKPVEFASFADFTRSVTATTPSLRLAVKGFFENGGTSCWLALAAEADLSRALDALAEHELALVCSPDQQNFPDAAKLLAGHCEQRRDRICVLHSGAPSISIATHQPPVRSAYAGYYYPWLTVADGKSTRTIPPSGHVAALLAKGAPASTALMGVLGVSQAIDETDSSALAARGINPIRSFPGKGVLVWGARTTSQDSEYRYLAIRRLAIFLEHSIEAGLQWTAFETNGPPLWAQVRSSVSDFLLSTWHGGKLLGRTAEEAFFVRCDQTTMTQNDIDSGRLIVLVGFASVRPAEFVILRIGAWTHTP
jgi:phage tail sheath protein FI